MAHLLTIFDDIVEGPNGTGYQPRACGRPCADGRWEGWLEFRPVGADVPTLCTSQETVQPDRSALEYWAAGLTHVFLEGALGRARERAQGASDGPTHRPVLPPPIRAVLDPFLVYAQGEDVLRQELSALAPMHLRNVLNAYALTDLSSDELARMDGPGLARCIVEGVRERLSSARTSSSEASPPPAIRSSGRAASGESRPASPR